MTEGEADEIDAARSEYRRAQRIATGSLIGLLLAWVAVGLGSVQVSASLHAGIWKGGEVGAILIVAAMVGMVAFAVARAPAHRARARLHLAQHRKCPDCGELVKLEARKCRHCGHAFE